MRRISKYEASTFLETKRVVIDCGTSDENVKWIQLPSNYRNAKYTYKPFENWPDTFELIQEGDRLKVRRSDVKNTGWGTQLIVDCQYEVGDYEAKSQNIPKVVYQTFESDEVTDGMASAIESWRSSNPEYQHHFFDANDRLEYIKRNFDQEVVDAYLDLIPGAFKADLWRYCVIYNEGGVYVDADTICTQPLIDWIDPDTDLVIVRDDPMSKDWLHNAFIASVPKNPFLKIAIDQIVDNVKHKRRLAHLDITGPELFGRVAKDYFNIKTNWQLGKQRLGDYNAKILFHDWQSKNHKLDGRPVLITEYNGKLDEMKQINVPTFYELYQQDRVYREIPRQIMYTTLNEFDTNRYMIESFSSNKEWKLHYYNDEHVSQWFETQPQRIRDFYNTLTNGGEKSDFFRYCWLYENGGLYTDADTYCNTELDKWITDQDLIVGLEAITGSDIGQINFWSQIGQPISEGLISVSNWTIAAKPKHPIFKGIIDDIIDNPIPNNVLINTGPGRWTKHVINWFGRDHDWSKDVVKDKAVCYSINRFGSNQHHSGAIKFANPLKPNLHEDIYISHMFAGTWRSSPSAMFHFLPSIPNANTHNLTIWQEGDQLKGVSRYEPKKSSTTFMKHLEPVQKLVEWTINPEGTSVYKIKDIQASIVGKYEDYRAFKWKGQTWFLVAYIDQDWNTYQGILDSKYRLVKTLRVDEPSTMNFTGTKRVIWEKNWLPLVQDDQLYIIYSTTPKFELYRVGNDWNLELVKQFEPINPIAENEWYRHAKASTGGSSTPVWSEKEQCWTYIIHTKIYSQRQYNHYRVKLSQDFNQVTIESEPIFHQYQPWPLLFITTEVEGWLSGGMEDRFNWILRT